MYIGHFIYFKIYLKTKILLNNLKIHLFLYFYEYKKYIYKCI